MTVVTSRTPDRAGIEDRLRGRGLRVTLPRLAVLEYLASTPSHPTADDVGQAVNRRVPTASRASIYNVLHSLTEAGLVEEFVFENAVARYDANLEAHHHFLCTACGKLEDVAWDAVPLSPSRHLPDGQQVDSAELILKGSCRACRETARA